ncbi:PREDICTED: single-pass membrane and coiled-coil domain-containing protein 4 [Mandrillus leucophaeus]|uniref:single-pass membrane and coiled-coil domain-containing protein 4 n=1 Tax=Mandrillus leucophaeus TaxID=9568 RepID=UPI0005F3B636|nr:PREDICTED: single-pass membrane and coiled-coil domain-containing protein 4 [Mandrillus leucophaeus]
MQQLKGKPRKETWKDKKEQKQTMQEARQQITTVALPTLATVVLLIVVFVYMATRPTINNPKSRSLEVRIAAGTSAPTPATG